jgi:hypothetical protein
MSAKIEGTLTLEGLIEGRLSGGAEPEKAARDWVELAHDAGLSFCLRIEAGFFSLLPSDAPFRADALGKAPEAVIAGLVEQLVRAFPPGAVTSTLRSTEYTPGTETQRLYLVGADRRVEVRSRSTAMETTPPPRALSGKQQAVIVLAGVAFALTVVGLSALFVDYRALWRHVRRELFAQDVAKITVDGTSFEGYFSVAKTVLENDETLVITLNRGPLFPMTEAEESRAAALDQPPAKRLAAEAVIAGYVRCEFFDDQGRFQDQATFPIKDLRSGVSMHLALPLPRSLHIQRVAITY